MLAQDGRQGEHFPGLIPQAAEAPAHHLADTLGDVDLTHRLRRHPPTVAMD